MADTLDDDYVRRTTSWIRTNESGLAGVRAPRSNAMNPLSWMAAPQKPATLTLTKAQLSYLLTRIEGTGINVGCLDIPIENPRPSQLLPKDTSDAQSITSFVSNLSLSPASWWTTPAAIETEIKYLYSAFTKLPTLHLRNPPSREPEKFAIPLDAFKNLQTLILEDIDPRSLLGWDRLAEALRSLTIKRSGIEDVTHLIVDAVVDDEGRRRRGDLTPIQRKLPGRKLSGQRSRASSWQASLRRNQSIPEVDEESVAAAQAPAPALSTTSSDTSPSLPKLSASKWWLLRHLSLADNGLTFFPSEVTPYLTSLTHLDLSHNLLISVPTGLDELHRLTSLNLAGNMIESVLGIYTQLGQVITINLAANRLESLCGLERLVGLKRIDLRDNRVEEAAEVGRLAILPHVSEVYVHGNPLTTLEEDWRVRCFSFFAKEGKQVTLDGSIPGYMEQGRIDALVGSPKSQPVTVISSPRGLAARSNGHARTASAAVGTVTPPTNGTNGATDGTPPQPLSDGSPALSAISPASSVKGPIHTHPKKKRKQPRIVDLGDDDSAARETSPDPHGKRRANGVRSPPLSSSPKAGIVITSQLNNTNPPQSSQPNQLAPAAVITESSADEQATSASEDRFGAMPITMRAPGTVFGRGRRGPSGSATISASTGGGGRSGKRRARVSASVYEPSAGTSPPSLSSSPQKPSSIKAANGEPTDLQFSSEAEAFRAKIQALRNEVGDSWLKVLSQSNNLSNSSGARSPPLSH